MSVVKSKRSESNIEFLNTAREVEIFYLKILAQKPKKYKAFLSDELIRLSADTYNNAKAANSIYPASADDAKLRRQYMLKAYCSNQMVISQTEVLYAVCQSDALSIKELEQIAHKLYDLDKLLKAVIKKDKERYKDLN